MVPDRRHRSCRHLHIAAATLLLLGCDNADGFGLRPFDSSVPDCDLDPAWLSDGGVGRDGIPALTDPPLVPISPTTPANAFVRDGDRVIVVRLGSEWIAIPHNIMWRHEIVNFNSEEDRIAVTFCPLTGSALAFGRRAADDDAMQVSGLLYHSNLVMYDTDSGSFWPQMIGEARCGARSGTRLERLPTLEMTMGGWRSLHPDGRMVGAPGGFDDWRLYVRNPYGDDYEDVHNGDFLGFAIARNDNRLPPKERVLGLPRSAAGSPPQAFSFEAMRSLGDHAVLSFSYNTIPAIVIWDSAREAAMAYRSEIGGRRAHFTATAEGVIDDLTGTTWAVDGRPTAGALAETGRTLRPLADAHVAFWTPWAAFHPETVLVLDEGARVER